jgi:hypothetical protein
MNQIHERAEPGETRGSLCVRCALIKHIAHCFCQMRFITDDRHMLGSILDSLSPCLDVESVQRHKAMINAAGLFRVSS